VTKKRGEGLVVTGELPRLRSDTLGEVRPLGIGTAKKDKNKNIPGKAQVRSEGRGEGAKRKEKKIETYGVFEEIVGGLRGRKR